jgi:autotransporter-associated beta strand protein
LTVTGGLVTAKTLILAPFKSSGICNINGGTLQTGTITRGSGVTNFNWNDGTIQNYDGNTNLTVSNSLILALAETGKHAFNIDQGRTGTVDAVLKNATINGTLTKTGAGILTLTGANTYSGETVIEAGTLKYSTAAAMTSGPYTVNGGTLDIGAISKSIGAFRITSGAVNGTGTLTSNAPYDVQAGTVNPRLAGTVGLNKNGAGVLMLTGANTYRGETVIEAGRFKVTGTILNTSEVTVNAAGTLELARTSGNATAATLPIGNDGMLLVSTGSQMAGAITGNGITQVNAGASLTASSIVQDSLIIGATGATAMGQVPEPSALVLLGMSGIGLLALACRGKRPFSLLAW